MVRKEVEEKDSLNDVGGWLLFFIITLTIISPLINIGNVFAEGVGAFEIVSILAEISLFILSGIFLWNKKPYAVNFTKIVLFTIGVELLIFSLVSSNFTLLKGVPYCVIWILYLYNSERVRQVYGKLKEPSTNFNVWSVMAIIYSFVQPIFGAIFAITSFIYISKNKKMKGLVLSILALIISIIMFISLFLYGALFGAAVGGYAPESIKTDCNNFCYNVNGANSYIVEYSSSEAGYVCNCMGNYKNIVDRKVFKEITGSSLTGNVIGNYEKPLNKYSPFPSIFNIKLKTESSPIKRIS